MTLNRVSLSRLLSVLLMAAALCASAFGQRTALTTTTLSAAIPAAPATNQKVITTISVASTSGMVSNTGALPANQGGIGGPASGTVATFLFIDAELDQINSINGNFVNVVRGVQGTPTMAHNSGATVYIVTGRQLVPSIGAVSGSCTSATQPLVIPYIYPPNGLTYDCPTTGPFANTWVVGGNAYSYQASSQNLNPNTIQTVSIPVTLAQLQTLHTVPIKVLPAFGAGTFSEITSCTLDLKYGSAAFSGGGTVTLGWGSSNSTTASAATIASTVFTTFSASQSITVAGALAVTADSLILNLPQWISAGSADFTAGTGATGVLDCSYRVHSGF